MGALLAALIVAAGAGASPQDGGRAGLLEALERGSAEEFATQLEAGSLHDAELVQIYADAPRALRSARTDLFLEHIREPWARAWMHQRAAIDATHFDRYTAAEAHLRAAAAIYAEGTWDAGYLEANRIELEMAWLGLHLARGLLDLAAPIAFELRQRLPELPPTDDPHARDRVARMVLDVARSYLGRDEYGLLHEFLGEQMQRGLVDARHRPQAEYWVGVALLELEGGAAARPFIERAYAGSQDGELLRFQAALRLARAALLEGDGLEAQRWLDAADRARPAEQELPAIERAHEAVFRLRSARLLHGELEPARAELYRTWEALLASWRRTDLRSGGLAFLHFRNPNRVLGEVLQERAQSAAGPAAALAELLRAEGAGSLVRQFHGGPTELEVERVRRVLLGPRRGALIYLPTHEGTHAFALGPDELLHAWLPATRPELRALAADLARRQRTHPDQDPDPSGRGAALARLGAQLHAALVPASFAALLEDWEHVYVVGADLLEPLRFEDLGPGPLEASLGRRHALAALPSLTLGALLAERAAARGTAATPAAELALFLGSGDGNGTLPQLRFSPRQLSALEGPFGSNVRLAGEAAARELVRAAPSARIFMFLGHGESLRTLERPARLLLAPGLHLGFDEIENWAHAPLHALLAACSAGVGPARAGDGGVGQLPGAFLLRGADSVLLPMEDVEADSTVAFAATYLERLARGCSPAQAARDARRILAQELGFTDPYHHGALSVLGLAHEPLFASKNTTTPVAWVAAGVGLFLLAGLALASRRRPAQKS